MRKITLVILLISSFFSLNVKNVLAAGTALIGTAEVYQKRGDNQCNFFNSCVQAGEDLQIKLIDLAHRDGKPIPDETPVNIYLIGTTLACRNLGDGYSKYVKAKNGIVQTSFLGKHIKASCSYEIKVSINKIGDPFYSDEKVYPTSSEAALQCNDENDGQCNTNLSIVANYDLCKQQIKKEAKEQLEACEKCVDKKGVWTAVGCIPSNPESVITTIITIGLAAGGGIVLIMILVGSFMLSVSQGDPNKTKEAKEIITSAVIGLLFVIFSVTILQFIGVEILHIPGFGE